MVKCEILRRFAQQDIATLDDWRPIHSSSNFLLAKADTMNMKTLLTELFIFS